MEFQVIALLILGLLFIAFGVFVLFLPEVKEKVKKMKGNKTHDLQ
jgi:hypothetical protein